MCIWDGSSILDSGYVCILGDGIYRWTQENSFDVLSSSSIWTKVSTGTSVLFHSVLDNFVWLRSIVIYVL